MRVDATTYEDACARLLTWANQDQARYVCVCSVHMVMEGRADPSFQNIVNSADLVTSDGMPLVFGLRWLGVPQAERVYGPELTPRLCEAAARAGVPVGFYGGTETVMADLLGQLAVRAPQLKVAYQYCPPFRPLTPEEDARQVAAIRASGAKILFVGIGCPRQERWMAEHRDQLPLVMVGVGAAFDFLAGHKPTAPAWMQRFALEWLFRLASEPRRLGRRYLAQIPRFIPLFAAQLFRERVLGRANGPS